MHVTHLHIARHAVVHVSCHVCCIGLQVQTLRELHQLRADMRGEMQMLFASVNDIKTQLGSREKNVKSCQTTKSRISERLLPSLHCVLLVCYRYERC